MPRQTVLEQSIYRAALAGWREFVKPYVAEKDRKNERMFRLLTLIRGAEFVDHLRRFMRGTKTDHSTLRVVRQPKGVWIPDRRFSTIPKIWIDGDSIYGKGDVYVQVKPDRWLKMNYSRD